MLPSKHICAADATSGGAERATQIETSLLSFLKERGRSSPDFLVRIDRSFLISAAVLRAGIGAGVQGRPEADRGAAVGPGRRRRAAHACSGGKRSCRIADPP